MNYRGLFMLFILLKALPSFAQRTDTIKIFYPINKFALSANDRLKINALVDSLHNNDTVRVLGYADYLGNREDNLVLSHNRAETIKKYMLSLKAGLSIRTDGKGEIDATSGRSTDGEPLNRRVDIIRTVPLKASPKTRSVERSVNKPPVIKADPVRPATELAENDSIPKDDRSFNDKINGLDKLEPGSSLSLEELTFQMGRHYLNPESVTYLNTLLGALKKHKNIVFQILGHVCCEYSTNDGYDRDTQEDKLSENRAKFIYDYFIKKGISRSRMTYKGLGGSKPKVWPETNWHDRYVNRRVEILIVSK